MRFRVVVALALLLFILLPQAASGQVVVTRGGDENPAVTITKSIFWGALGGLIVGGAIALVIDDNQGDAVKWGFVGGTGLGLAAGIWHVANRPQPQSALLRIDPEGAAVGIPATDPRATIGVDAGDRRESKLHAGARTPRASRWRPLSSPQRNDRVRGAGSARQSGIAFPRPARFEASEEFSRSLPLTRRRRTSRGF